MTEDLDTICPFCGHHHDAVSAFHSDTDFPNDGNITMCFGCGQFCVFDSDADGRLRKPTKKEQRVIDHDEDAQTLRNAWKIVRQ
jgi:hypothetical protein